MKCPKCGKEVEIQKRKAGVDSSGNPVYNRYAVCRECKKMWNLDKPKARKPDVAAAVKNKEIKIIPETKPADAPTGQRPRPETKSADAPAKKRQAPAKAGQKYSNIPPESVRSKSAKAVKENYSSMLSTDPASVAVKDRVEQKSERKTVYRAFRTVLGIFAVLSSGLFGYMAYREGFKNLSLSELQAPIMVYVVLAACMMLSGLILLISQKANSVFAFLVPMLTSLSGTLFAFMSHSDLFVIKIYAIGCALFTVALLVITITSRFALNFEDDYEDVDGGRSYAAEKSKEKRIPDDDFDDDFYNDDDE